MDKECSSLLQPRFKYWDSNLGVENSVGRKDTKDNWVNSWKFYRAQDNRQKYCEMMKNSNCVGPIGTKDH